MANQPRNGQERSMERGDFAYEQHVEDMLREEQFQQSLGLDSMQQQFIEQTDFDLSRFLQKMLTKEQILQAIGVCGVCGDIIYSGSVGEYNTSSGWASYGGSSLGGKKLGLDESYEYVDLCEEHNTEFMDTSNREFNGEDVDSVEYPDLDYITDVYFGDVPGYMMEMHAVKHAQPDTKYGELLISKRDEFVLPDDEKLYREHLGEALKTWLTDEDTPRGLHRLDFYDVWEEAEAFDTER